MKMVFKRTKLHLWLVHKVKEFLFGRGTSPRGEGRWSLLPGPSPRRPTDTITLSNPHLIFDNSNAAKQIPNPGDAQPWTAKPWAA